MTERVISQARITYKMREGYTRRFPLPFTYMTMRDRFDNLLAQRAVSAGAELLEGFKVDRIDQDNGGFAIRSQREAFTSRVLVGADGANSTVAHRLGLLKGAEIGVGLESEVYTDELHLEPWRHTISINFGTLRGGYMWLFPKEDHLSIGVAGFVKFGGKLRHLLDRYLKALQLGPYQEQLTRGHRLLRRRKGIPIHKDGALLVGDAAGLIDYWTGEGIYYALRSAQLAVPAICDYLEGRASDLRPYEECIDHHLMPELHIARTLTRLGVWFPRLAYTLMKNSDWAWNTGCEVLRADKTYYDVRAKMGRLSFLFDLAGIGT